ncbi:PRC and DUF2382 domain-containing protein [Rhodococcus sp. X156]|uniref:DUF2382 domain-containing protein n=1 Tax=Rhodococcus sp. X156 TaxID=2499145 RepID=UPI0019D002FE|nr:PRC and DUF2382 domain-containing protein [Rhodococcus sp. X156]
MANPRTMSPDQLEGLQVKDGSGSKVGKVDAIYLDVETNQPEWAAVKTGFFGGHVTLVPLVDASLEEKDLTVPYSKNLIKDAPHHDPGGDLSTDEEIELFTYYDVPYSGSTATADTSSSGTGSSGSSGSSSSGSSETSSSGTSSAGSSGSASSSAGQASQSSSSGHDTSGPNTDDAMTRSEEEVSVSTERVRTGRARLRKHVVTETVTQSVPVSHEEVRVQREPITDANVDAATSGPEISEEEHEVTLHAEEPVVEKKTVPKERVRMDTETVRGEEKVSEQVRKEQIDQVTDDDKGHKRS